MKTRVGAGAAAALVTLAALLLAISAGAHSQGGGRQGLGKGPFAELSSEQREAVHRRVEEMRADGAAPEEIHEAVGEMLRGYGVELPEGWGEHGGPPGFAPGRHGFLCDLTEEQRQAVQQRVADMRSQGATHEEVHRAVAEMVQDYGVELPRDWGEHHGPEGSGRGSEGLMRGLNDEQRQAVRARIKEMRAEGAAPEEVHEAVGEMLRGYGVELPEDWGERRGPPGFGPGRHGILGALTDEQRQAVHERIGEMRAEGAAPEEIHEAVGKMLRGYGVQFPESVSGTPTASEPPTPLAATPAAFHMEAKATPNPFSAETQISYALSVAQDVRVQVYNTAGQVVRTFPLGRQGPGNYSVVWNGRDDKGEAVPGGMYYCRIETGAYAVEVGPYAVTKRVVLIR